MRIHAPRSDRSNAFWNTPVFQFAVMAAAKSWLEFSAGIFHGSDPWDIQTHLQISCYLKQQLSPILLRFPLSSPLGYFWGVQKRLNPGWKHQPGFINLVRLAAAIRLSNRCYKFVLLITLLEYILIIAALRMPAGTHWQITTFQKKEQTAPANKCLCFVNVVANIVL